VKVVKVIATITLTVSMTVYLSPQTWICVKK